MNKKELKAKWEKAKQWCKDHKTEILMVATCGVVGGISAGSGYKKGWKDGVDKCEDYMYEHAAVLTLKEPITPRDLMNDEAIARAHDNKVDGAADRLDTPIKEVMFWFD